MSNFKPVSGERWVRKNKNVQVRICPTNKKDSVFFEDCLNGHSKSMSLDKFLNEFIDLDKAVMKIHEDTRWINKHHDYPIVITEVRRIAAMIYYRYEHENKHYCYSENVGKFLQMFKPELTEGQA